MVEQEDTTQIFVYGSLKKGMSEHSRLAGAVLQSNVMTAPRYALYDCGLWPAMVGGGKTCIAGELYEIAINVLPLLDSYEGHPLVFKRQSILLASGNTSLAWLYVGDIRGDWPPIESGAWHGPSHL